MAAAISQRALRFARNIYLLGRCNPVVIANCRTVHISNLEDEKERKVVLNDDGSMILCWHPAQDFPYEHSKPIPQMEPELVETDSVLNVQQRLLHKHRYRPSGPTMAELQQLTYTTKHLWYPEGRDKKIERMNKLPKYRDTL